MNSKNISIRLNEDTIFGIKKSGNVDKFSKKVQSILDEYLEDEYFRSSHWMPISHGLLSFLLNELTDEGIEKFIHIHNAEIEKLRIWQGEKNTIFDTWQESVVKWHKKAGYPFKIASTKNGSVAIISEHDLGEVFSKLMINSYTHFAEKDSKKIIKPEISSSYFSLIVENKQV